MMQIWMKQKDMEFSDLIKFDRMMMEHTNYRKALKLENPDLEKYWIMVGEHEETRIFDIDDDNIDFNEYRFMSFGFLNHGDLVEKNGVFILIGNEIENGVIDFGDLPGDFDFDGDDFFEIEGTKSEDPSIENEISTKAEEYKKFEKYIVDPTQKLGRPRKNPKEEENRKKNKVESAKLQIETAKDNYWEHASAQSEDDVPEWFFNEENEKWQEYKKIQKDLSKKIDEAKANYEQEKKNEVQTYLDKVKSNRKWSKGTYEDTIKSIEFKNWFGNSKVLNKNKKPQETGSIEYGEIEPIVLFHGTTHKFNEFTLENANIENDVGRGFYFTDNYKDVMKNYKSTGPDLTNRIDRTKEYIENELPNDDMDEIRHLGEKHNLNEEDFDNEDAWIEAIAGKEAYSKNVGEIKDGKILETFLKIEKPVIIDLDNPQNPPHITMIDSDYLEEKPKEEDYADEDEYIDALDNWEMYAEADHNQIKDAFFEALEENGYDDYEQYDNALYKLREEFDDENEISTTSLYSAIKGLEMFEDNNDGVFALGQVVADTFMKLGFDGIVYNDATRHFSNMGMAPGTKHYVVWDSKQIKSISSENFDVTSGNIFKSEKFEKYVVDPSQELGRPRVHPKDETKESPSKPKKASSVEKIQDAIDEIAELTNTVKDQFEKYRSYDDELEKLWDEREKYKYESTHRGKPELTEEDKINKQKQDEIDTKRKEMEKKRDEFGDWYLLKDEIRKKERNLNVIKFKHDKENYMEEKKVELDSIVSGISNETKTMSKMKIQETLFEVFWGNLNKQEIKYIVDRTTYSHEDERGFHTATYFPAKEVFENTITYLNNRTKKVKNAIFKERNAIAEKIGDIRMSTASPRRKFNEPNIDYKKRLEGLISKLKEIDDQLPSVSTKATGDKYVVDKTQKKGRPRKHLKKDIALIKRPDSLSDSKKKELLYRFLPRETKPGEKFDIDWVEDRISGKKQLKITKKNFQVGVQQFANVLAALFTLNDEHQTGEYSDVIIQFLERKLKDYRKFADELGEGLMKIGAILAPDPDKATKSQNESFDTLNKCVGFLKDFDLVFKSTRKESSKSVKKVKSKLKQWQDKI